MLNTITAKIFLFSLWLPDRKNTKTFQLTGDFKKGRRINNIPTKVWVIKIRQTAFDSVIFIPMLEPTLQVEGDHAMRYGKNTISFQRNKKGVTHRQN